MGRYADEALEQVDELDEYRLCRAFRAMEMRLVGGTGRDPNATAEQKRIGKVLDRARNDCAKAATWQDRIDVMAAAMSAAYGVDGAVTAARLRRHHGREQLPDPEQRRKYLNAMEARFQ
jgi:hypothetical protein